MQMKIKLVRKAEQVTSQWQGGTTTQLYIFPSSASYRERDFLFRISTATVETEESTFTALPGVSRELMILQGELIITHENRYTKTLKAFDTDTFEGDWLTTGAGKVTDFNLMTMGGTSGSLNHVALKKDQQYSVPATGTNPFIGLYTWSGSVMITVNKIIHRLHEMDFVGIFPAEADTITIEAMEDSHIIITKMAHLNNHETIDWDFLHFYMINI